MKRIVLALSMLLMSALAFSQQPVPTAGSTFYCNYNPAGSPTEYNAPPLSPLAAASACETFGWLLDNVENPSSTRYDNCTPLNPTEYWAPTNQYPNQYYYQVFVTAYDVSGRTCTGVLETAVGVLTGGLECPAPSQEIGSNYGIPNCGCPAQNGIPAYWERDSNGNSTCNPDPVYINPFTVPNDSNPTSMYAPAKGSVPQAYAASTGFVATAATENFSMSDNVSMTLSANGVFPNSAGTYTNNGQLPTVINDAGQQMSTSIYGHVGSMGRAPMASYNGTINGLTVGAHYTFKFSGTATSVDGANSTMAPLNVSLWDSTKVLNASQLDVNYLPVGKSVGTLINIPQSTGALAYGSGFVANNITQTITISTGGSLITPSTGVTSTWTNIPSQPTVKDAQGNLVSVTWKVLPTCWWSASARGPCYIPAQLWVGTASSFIAGQHYSISTMLTATTLNGPIAGQVSPYYITVK